MEAKHPLWTEMVRGTTHAFTLIACDEPLLPQGAEGGGGVGRRKPQPCRESGHGGRSIEEFVEDPPLVPAADA